MNKAYLYHLRNECILAKKEGIFPGDYKIAAVLRVGDLIESAAADQVFHLTSGQPTITNFSPAQTLGKYYSPQQPGVLWVGESRNTCAGDLVLVPTKNGHYEYRKFLAIGSERVGITNG